MKGASLTAFVIWESTIVVKGATKFTDAAVASHSRNGCCQVRTACLHSFLRRGKLVVHAQHAGPPTLLVGMWKQPALAVEQRAGVRGRRGRA